MSGQLEGGSWKFTGLQSLGCIIGGGRWDGVIWEFVRSLKDGICGVSAGIGASAGSDFAAAGAAAAGRKRLGNILLLLFTGGSGWLLLLFSSRIFLSASSLTPAAMRGDSLLRRTIVRWKAPSKVWKAVRTA